MTEYPKHIRDEVARRLNDAYKILAKDVAVEPMAFYPDRISHVALADLLIESGFKPPVDPLLREIWDMCGNAHYNDASFEDFCTALAHKGLAVTVTKAGDA